VEGPPDGYPKSAHLKALLARAGFGGRARADAQEVMDLVEQRLVSAFDARELPARSFHCTGSRRRIESVGRTARSRLECHRGGPHVVHHTEHRRRKDRAHVEQQPLDQLHVRLASIPAALDSARGYVRFAALQGSDTGPHRVDGVGHQLAQNSADLR